MIRWLWRLGLAAAGLVAASAVAVLVVAVWSTPCADLAQGDGGPDYDIAVALGAGMDPNGTLHDSTLRRVAAGVALLQAGRAQTLHMTGGRAVPDGPAAGDRMARHAVALGADPGKITRENAALSTLQNALFSGPSIPAGASVVVVSEGFHLMRSWASFRWAGLPVDAVCHSTRFRRSPDGARWDVARMVVREVAAVWFNLARAAMWSVLHGLGRDRAAIDPLLA
ncbi:MAG: YdcF family protein [Rhodobacter sp.]|nr:YdcF family protein [Rhodobacter sp.]